MSVNFCNNNSLSAITSIPASICGGYLNLTTQYSGLRFIMSSGNISAGNILIFGISDS